MAAIITTQIELDKIPKDKIRTFKRKDGSTGKAVDIQVTANDEIKFDNNVSVALAQTKEQRENGEQKTYLGNGRVVWSDGNINTYYELEEGEPAHAGSSDDGLPF